MVGEVLQECMNDSTFLSKFSGIVKQGYSYFILSPSPPESWYKGKLGKLGVNKKLRIDFVKAKIIPRRGNMLGRKDFADYVLCVQEVVTHFM